jgi:uncharacterized protein YndB with AHSA1/START domain
MKTNVKTKINVGTYVHAPVERVWQVWTDPFHIKRWNNASTDWFTPYAENDLREGGSFISRMEARDGSSGFDFTGTYDIVEPHRLIEYTMDDGRRVRVEFTADGNRTRISETFEAESSNPEDLQREGWQAILDNFKYHAEKNPRLEPMQFEIEINTSPDRVYQVMIDENCYPVWTAEFSPSSHFEGSWERGSDIRFIGEDQEGNMGGMISKIRENSPGRFISIEHQGILKEGQVIREGPEVNPWAGGLEEYTFIERDGRTLLSIDVDVSNDYKSYFEGTWPKALEKLKTLCEQDGMC